MSLQHIIKQNVNSSSLGLPINSISPPAISSTYLVTGTSAGIESTVLSPTAAELPSGVFKATGTTVTFTPPTAALMYANLVSNGIIPSIGTSFPFQVDNQGSGALTMATSAGVTYRGSATMAAALKRSFIWRFNDVTTPTAEIW